MEEKATSHFVDVVFVQSTPAIDSNGSLDLLNIHFTYHVERRGYSKKVMGECLPKGQLAVEPAANQRLVAKAFLAR